MSEKIIHEILCWYSLKEEKQLLRAKAQFLIMQKSTWDSLLSTLQREELESIRSSSDVVSTYRMQHAYKQRVRREEYATNMQQWIVSVLLHITSFCDLVAALFSNYRSKYVVDCSDVWVTTIVVGSSTITYCCNYHL